MRKVQKTKRHRNRSTRKRGGENWWEKIETRNRESNSNVIPLPKPIRLIGEQYVPSQLSNARESYRSKRINQILARNAAMHPIHQNHDANAAMLAARSSAIVSSRAEKEAAKVEEAKAQAANLGRATMKGLLSNKLKKVINSRKYYGPTSRINNNKKMEQYLTNSSKSITQ
jgi:hypothetical protein